MASTVVITWFNIKVGLNTERYAYVQVVLLLALKCLYQELFTEVDSKYGGRETSEGSLVSCRSKDNMACDGPLPSSSVNQTFIVNSDLTTNN
jgi:hypothetical protein